MHSEEIRSRYLAFFEKRGHAVISSAPLVPQNDPSVLFNTAGMQPLVPYLLGQKHPAGSRLVNVQKCVRTQDIEEVGDKTHDTFFEMLGNWSLGDYFKEEAIAWSFEFLTSKEEGLGLDPERLYVTVFEGDENAPRDVEAFEIWKKYIPEHRIYFMGAKSNWWSVGENGPCGPDTEMFYDITPEGLGDMTREEYMVADEAQKVVEIWNDVFMEYEKKDGVVVGKLAQRNVDTGAGLERIAMMVQKKDDVFATDLFAPTMVKIDAYTEGLGDMRVKRIVADHVRTSVFMIAAGVVPSNTAQGYILRRLLRRAVRFADVLGMKPGTLALLAEAVIATYAATYPEIANATDSIKKEIGAEEGKFRETLEKGTRLLATMTQHAKHIDGQQLFDLWTVHGFPEELSLEIARENGTEIVPTAHDEYLALMEKHQALSRTASAGMFKGGLANHNEKTIRLHTAHHLLLAALQQVLGPQVKQRGSNITEERLRLDFSFERKMTDEEKKQVEAIVNEKIQAALPVHHVEMPKSEAEALGAQMEFGAKYGDTVSVYMIGANDSAAFSKEFCGGPHVNNTSEIGQFKIQKEEASSQGVRRIKAVII